MFDNLGKRSLRNKEQAVFQVCGNIERSAKMRNAYCDELLDRRKDVTILVIKHSKLVSGMILDYLPF
jgi:hypothetical protein